MVVCQIVGALRRAVLNKIAGGRFLLGLSSGDRPTQYPAFAADFNNRAEHYREAWANHPPLNAGKIPRVQ